jgi:OPT oligopeptide transporter protein
MGIFTFDWGQITAFSNSPLGTPWWAMANIAITIVLFYWILLPILYVRPPCFPLFFELLDFLGIVFGSTPMFGTVLTFPWCLHTPSIIQGAYTTSLESSTPVFR